jgi:hypothetical protein
MSKRDGFHLQFYKQGQLTLPENEAERKEVVRSLFGADMISCVDSWIEQGQKILKGHSEFADFSDEQKTAVLALVSHCAYGALFSQCARMDQFDHGEIEIQFNEIDEEDGHVLRSTQIAGLREDELHHTFLDWADQFGDHYDYHSGSRFSTPPSAESL